MATVPSQGKLLYHITHLNNIPSILKYGLMPRKKLIKKGLVEITDIADPEILKKRETFKTDLSNYVPFHFYPKNPFDGSVCKTYGSDNMAIITIFRAAHEDLKFFIIPSHPLDNSEPDIYPYEEGFNLINWDILDGKIERDYHDPEVKKACMAECVVPYIIKSQAFCCIFVQNQKAKDWIMGLPNSMNLKINVNPKMFP